MNFDVNEIMLIFIIPKRNSAPNRKYKIAFYS
jgi:hypothetical protein